MRTALLLTIFGGGVAQATLGNALRIADVTPDIPLIMVVLVALARTSAAWRGLRPASCRTWPAGV